MILHFFRIISLLLNIPVDIEKNFDFLEGYEYLVADTPTQKQIAYLWQDYKSLSAPVPYFSGQLTYYISPISEISMRKLRRFVANLSEFLDQSKSRRDSAVELLSTIIW